jgi:hypothetical protein
MTKDQRKYLDECILAVRHIVENAHPDFLPKLTRFLILGMKGLPGEVALHSIDYQEGYAAGFEAGYSAGVGGKKPKAPAKKKTVLRIVKK